MLNLVVHKVTTGR